MRFEKYFSARMCVFGEEWAVCRSCFSVKTKPRNNRRDAVASFIVSDLFAQL